MCENRRRYSFLLKLLYNPVCIKVIPGSEFQALLSLLVLCRLSDSLLLQSQPQPEGRDFLSAPRDTLPSSLHWSSDLCLCTPPRRTAEPYPMELCLFSDPPRKAGLGGRGRRLFPGCRYSQEALGVMASSPGPSSGPFMGLCLGWWGLPGQSGNKTLEKTFVLQ